MRKPPLLWASALRPRGLLAFEEHKTFVLQRPLDRNTAEQYRTSVNYRRSGLVMGGGAGRCQRAVRLPSKTLRDERALRLSRHDLVTARTAPLRNIGLSVQSRASED
jgi:hypothetical protein